MIWNTVSAMECLYSNVEHLILICSVPTRCGMRERMRESTECLTGLSEVHCVRHSHTITIRSEQ